MTSTYSKNCEGDNPCLNLCTLKIFFKKTRIMGTGKRKNVSAEWTSACSKLMREHPAQLRIWDEKCRLVSKVFNGDPRFEYILVNPVTGYCPFPSCSHRKCKNLRILYEFIKLFTRVQDVVELECPACAVHPHCQRTQSQLQR